MCLRDWHNVFVDDIFPTWGNGREDFEGFGWDMLSFAYDHGGGLRTYERVMKWF